MAITGADEAKTSSAKKIIFKVVFYMPFNEEMK